MLCPPVRPPAPPGNWAYVKERQRVKANIKKDLIKFVISEPVVFLNLIERKVLLKNPDFQ